MTKPPKKPRAADASEAPKPKTAPKKINLGLQGGGAHGAFTWGVLDHLLADPRIDIEGISGTSAGAMNAVMLADGLARGGSEEARKRLADFWRAASRDGNLTDLERTVMDRLFQFTPYEGSPVQAWFNVIAQYMSPYDLNPLNINPLHDLIERFVDFDAVRACKEVSLFIAATNVHTGRLRIFPQDKLSADVIIASACLPFLFRAVEIDGIPYWDGGYMANPAIFPFFRETLTEDMNRINEITFNSSLLAEFRAIEFVTRMIDQGKLPHGTGPGEYRRINVHRITLDSAFKELTAGSKLNSDFDFFQMLRDGGRKAAETFLNEHFDDIGVRSTIDLGAEAKA